MKILYLFISLYFFNSLAMHEKEKALDSLSGSPVLARAGTVMDLTTITQMEGLSIPSPQSKRNHELLSKSDAMPKPYKKKGKLGTVCAIEMKCRIPAGIEEVIECSESNFSQKQEILKSFIEQMRQTQDIFKDALTYFIKDLALDTEKFMERLSKRLDEENEILCDLEKRVEELAKTFKEKHYPSEQERDFDRNFLERKTEALKRHYKNKLSLEAAISIWFMYKNCDVYPKEFRRERMQEFEGWATKKVEAERQQKK